jgi:hypothetical protein
MVSGRYPTPRHFSKRGASDVDVINSGIKEKYV